MLYEFKVKGKGIYWDNTVVFRMLDFTKYADAITFAKGLAIEYNAECRMNEKGSRQGHYFHPKQLQIEVL